jgi:glycine cleavage system regulatory protein
VNTSLVLTLLGSDRPGLVEAVAKVVHAHDGNWLESRMARLATKFAGLLLLFVPEERAEALIAALGELKSTGLTIVVERAAAAPRTDSRAHYSLDLEGQDRPGIVRQVSQILAGLGVSVDELSTEWREAPMAGGTLFSARADLHLPPSVTSADVQKALEAIAQDLMVEITVADRPS